MQAVTAIIPNWNRGGLLRLALESIRNQTAPPARILVIDGGSSGDSEVVSREAGAEFVNLGSNRGFAHAVNEGVRLAHSEWLAILNNDVELAPDYFAKLTAVAPDVAFATGKILSYHDRTRIDGAFDLVSRAFCPWRAGSGQIDGSPWDKPRTIQLAPFTALLIRRPVFSRIGPLDARFESYLEDTDFGIRCALAGLAGMYVPQAVAFHRGSATLGAWSNRMVRLNSRNQVFLVAKHSPEPGSQAVVVGQLLWGLLALRHGTGSAWARGKWDAFRQYKAMRSQPHTGIAALLAESEGQIRELSRDTYWRWYFRLAGRAL